MKCSIKALNPIYKAYVNRITSQVSGIPGVLSVNLDSEGQYDFTFTFEKDKESNLSQITEQIRYLLRVYGSTILTIDTILLLPQTRHMHKWIKWLITS